MTHPHLTDIDEAGLRYEISEAKARLEQIVGKPVEHFSCPGGRYDCHVSEVVRHAGFRSMATSRIHANSASTDRFALGRVAIMRGTNLGAFGRLCEGIHRWPRIRQKCTDAAKQLLGNGLYDRARLNMLRAYESVPGNSDR